MEILSVVSIPRCISAVTVRSCVYTWVAVPVSRSTAAQLFSDFSPSCIFRRPKNKYRNHASLKRQILCPFVENSSPWKQSQDVSAECFKVILKAHFWKTCRGSWWKYVFSWFGWSDPSPLASSCGGCCCCCSRADWLTLSVFVRFSWRPVGSNLLLGTK